MPLTAAIQESLQLSLPTAPCRREPLKGIKVVLFDLDDTLIDTLRSTYESVTRLGLKLDLPSLSEDSFRESYGEPFQSTVPRWYPTEDLHPMAFRECFERECKKASIPQLFDVGGLIKHLVDHGIKVGIVTNSGDERTVWKMKASGIDPSWLSCVVTRDSAGGLLKPNPRSIEIAMTQLAVDRKEAVLFVGNALEDQEAAIRAGIHFCAVGRLERWDAHLNPYSYCLESAAQVGEIIDLSSTAYA